MGKNNAIGGGGFHHIAMTVSDFDKSVRFYTEALGFVKDIEWGENDKRAIMLDTGDGNYIELFAGGAPGERPKGVIEHFALRTANCAAAMKRATDAGAEITMNVTDINIPSNPETPVTIGFVKGPDGEIIEFFQER
jgi:glyoxylase I family protein